MPMATKLRKGVTFHEGVSPIKSHDYIISWSCEITSQNKNKKPFRVMGYCEKLSPLKSHDPLIAWSCDFDFLFL